MLLSPILIATVQHVVAGADYTTDWNVLSPNLRGPHPDHFSNGVSRGGDDAGLGETVMYLTDR